MCLVAKLRSTIYNNLREALSRNSCIDIKGPQSQGDFQYDALELRNMFRFLTLLPGSGDDEIVCGLWAHRVDFTTGAGAFDHNLSYEALSHITPGGASLTC